MKSILQLYIIFIYVKFQYIYLCKFYFNFVNLLYLVLSIIFYRLLSILCYYQCYAISRKIINIYFARYVKHEIKCTFIPSFQHPVKISEFIRFSFYMNKRKTKKYHICKGMAKGRLFCALNIRGRGQMAEIGYVVQTLHFFARNFFEKK